MESKPYKCIISHYEACLARHGDSHLGVDWPSREDAETRYRVMLELIPPTNGRSVTLLDFGCGASHLYDYITRNPLDYVHYSGLDISSKSVELCRAKYPHINYYLLDILEPRVDLPEFDYIVMNGVFTEKRELCHAKMLGYFQDVIRTAFTKVRIGLAFNVMSTQVDWERDDLFHLSLDSVGDFLTSQISRHFVIRHDYRLFEYTVYVYR